MEDVELLFDKLIEECIVIPCIKICFKVEIFLSVAQIYWELVIC